MADTNMTATNTPEPTAANKRTLTLNPLTLNPVF